MTQIETENKIQALLETVKKANSKVLIDVLGRTYHVADAFVAFQQIEEIVLMLNRELVFENKDTMIEEIMIAPDEQRLDVFIDTLSHLTIEQNMQYFIDINI